jgi:uncharacterized membrane protein YesL
MDGVLWFLVTVLGPLVLGLVIGTMLFRTYRRRNDPVAQARSDAATHQLYKDEDKHDT